MNLKCFYELPCDDLASIQDQALYYLNSLYDLSDQRSLKTDLWLKIDTVSFLKNNRLLVKWFQTMNLKAQEIALTVINDFDGAKLHIDELPVVAKINFPLMNYQHVVNEWWDVPTDILQEVGHKTNRFGSQFYDLGSVDLHRCNKITEIEMSGPIVFNSQIPHRVVVQPNARFPRVILTCMFWNQPLTYLE